MNTWLPLSLSAMFLWGIWGLMGKLAGRSITSQNLMLLATIGSMIIFPIALGLFYKYFNFQFNSPNHYFAVAGGAIGAIGGLLFFFAISKGDASKVVCITAMYPVVTALLSFAFLKEPITATKLTGIGLAISGVLLLAK